MSIQILATGSYVPEKVVTNDMLAQMVDTSNEWITQRVGINERRVSTNETAADFAVKAATDALASGNICADELDMIIAATISSDSLCPTVAGSVQAAIGATCPAFDINSACSGFLFALDTAVSYIIRKKLKKILVIGAERLSKLVDWNDRSTCIIFGDGAGAAVIAPGEGYLSSLLYTSGEDKVIRIPGGEGHSPFYNAKGISPFIFMDGQETFKFAVSKMVEDIKQVATDAGITLENIDHVVTHQANIRIIEYASRRLKLPMDKFAVNIDKYGNTSSASIPIALDELAKSGKLRKGDLIAMSAFGGGLSSAACIIRW